MSKTQSNQNGLRFNQYANKNNNQVDDILDDVRHARATSSLDIVLTETSHLLNFSDEYFASVDALIVGLKDYEKNLKSTLKEKENKPKYISDYYHSTPKNAKTLFDKIKLESDPRLNELKTLLYSFIKVLDLEDPTWTSKNEIHLEKKKEEITENGVADITPDQQTEASPQPEPAEEKKVIANIIQLKPSKFVSQKPAVNKQNNSLLIVASQKNTNQKDELLDDLAKSQDSNSINSNKLQNNAFEDNSHFARVYLPEEPPKSPTRTSCSLFTPTKTNVTGGGIAISGTLLGGALIAAGTGAGIPIAIGLLLLAAITAVGTGVVRNFVSEPKA